MTTLTKPDVEIPYEAEFEQLIAKDYARLAEQGHTYLDYTGGNLYAQSQLTKHHEMLSQHVFGNPHSTNPTSMVHHRWWHRSDLYRDGLSLHPSACI